MIMMTMMNSIKGQLIKMFLKKEDSGFVILHGIDNEYGKK
jgi:hypothetical protein